MADQERMIAEQSNQMVELSRKVQEGAQAANQPSGLDAEQQRQIAGQSRQMAEMSRRMDDESRNARDSRDSDGQQQRRLEEQERSISDQNRRMAAIDRKLEEQSRSADAGSKGKDDGRDLRESDQSREITELRRMVEEAGRSTRDAVSDAQNPSRPRRQQVLNKSASQTVSERSELDFGDEIDDTSFQGQDDSFLDDSHLDDSVVNRQERIERTRRPVGKREENASRRRDQRAGGGRGVDSPGDKERRPSSPKPDGSREPRPAKTGGNKMVLNHSEYLVNDDVEEQLRTGSGSHVYDEYQQLFETVGGAEGLEDSLENSAPLDVNLLASLVRWTTLAKVRVGEARLKNILELYLGLGPELTSVARVAD